MPIVYEVEAEPIAKGVAEEPLLQIKTC
uniref:Uncharacterized protein n=1 Tax=Arundo donax TaxID=35708 RepID=A0A0A8ZDI7_ARUDO